MNYLLLSVGRRCELLKNFIRSAEKGSKLIATDLSPYAPAMYFADKHYLVPEIHNPNYIDVILDICVKEDINCVTTFIDPEIEFLSKNRKKFNVIGVEVLAPYDEVASLCFDKLSLFKHLTKHGIPTVMTWGSIEEFNKILESGKAYFPVFVKPRNGSGSIGAEIMYDYQALSEAVRKNPNLIIQEFMSCEDIDADVYVDTITHKAVSAFLKKKIETRIGGACKAISFKDEKLFRLISEITGILRFNGPVDMDFFCRNGQYYLSEINPRFGGAYLHAYESGIDFIKMIENNLKGIPNISHFGNYEKDIVMMMYDSIVIKRADELIKL